MKKLFFLIAYICVAFVLNAQNSYEEAIKQGDSASNEGNYKVAISKYFAAEAFDPSKKEIVNSRVNAVFAKIDKLRKEAELAKSQSQRTLQQLRIEQANVQAALAETQKAKLQTDSALQKANRLINAIYFYEDKYALSYAYGNYFFINKNGDEITSLGKWEKAEQFDRNGFAKVKKNDGSALVDYLLDTLGNVYRISFDAKKLKEEVVLDLSKQQLTAIPEEVFKQTSLKVLILNNNQLDRLPAEIGELKDLVVLDLKYNKLSNLPGEIGRMESLRFLDLNHNKLNALPDEICNLNNLRYLGLDENALSGLPVEIGRMDKLTELYLNNNKLHDLPPKIGRLKNLTQLRLNNNQLGFLPSEIGQLNTLTLLDLSNNNLRYLPSEINGLKSLGKLYLYNNKLENLPEQIKDLKKITILDASGNNIRFLPNGIGGLRSLIRLDLSRNQISMLPPEIGMLKDLVDCNLNNNKLSSIPIQIGGLINLVSLDISQNNLVDLPDTIGSLYKLKKIYIAFNKFTTLSKAAHRVVDYETFNLLKAVKIYESADSLLKRLHSINDTVIVINFWATWCRPCVEGIGYFDMLPKELNGKPMKVILISLDFKSQMEYKIIPFLKKHPINSDIVILADQDAETWIPKFIPEWDGAIPASMIFDSGKKRFYLGDFHEYDDLRNWIYIK